MRVNADATTIEVRVGPDDRGRIEEAAAELGVAVEDFVRESASAHAADVLAERDAAALPPKAARRLIEALDEDRPPPSGLRELFERPSPFE